MREKDKPLNDLTKNILLWVVIVFVLLLVFSRYIRLPWDSGSCLFAVLDDVKAEQVSPWSCSRR